ncbi:MAG: FAD-binding monooxygenase, partial [Pseudomonadota bacterium]|nr:FAD-binding monooxygenase [Pseudomonadota bacterium]
RSAAEHRIRRAVAALARRYPFARELVNTGRMAQANPYPASRSAGAGARSLQNVAFDATTLMRCLAKGTRFLGLAIGADGAALQRLEPLRSRWPVEFRGLDAASPLAVHLGVAAGSFVLVRPDAYVAATLADASPAGVEAALRAALARL